MAAMSMEIRHEQRAANVDVNMYWSKRYGIPIGPTPCHVLGLFQSDMAPVFVCELQDGHVLECETDRVQFVDKEVHDACNID